jgi:hypothetical protein
MTEARRGRRGFGDEDEEAGEKLVDVGARAELGEFGEEFGGELFRVVLQPLGHIEQSGMAETKMGAGVQNSSGVESVSLEETRAAFRTLRLRTVC